MKLRAESALRARRLRRESTPAEMALWNLLRNRQVAGAKFRRQHPLGPFFADFYCKSAGLCVEADGAGHYPPRQQLERDAWLRSSGIRILRFENREILDEPERVIATIRAALLAPEAG